MGTGTRTKVAKLGTRPPKFERDRETERRQRAIDQFYKALGADEGDEPEDEDEGEREPGPYDKIIGQQGPAGEIIGWTDGHRAILIPGEPPERLEGPVWSSVANHARPGWQVPANLAAMLTRARVFSNPKKSQTAAVLLEHDGAALRLSASWGGDSCSEWTPSTSACAGVLTLDLRYLMPVAVLAAAGFDIAAQWTPDADEPIAFTLPSGARYIIQPVKMTRKAAAEVEESEAA